jgi:hypothetical protein
MRYPLQGKCASKARLNVANLINSLLNPNPAAAPGEVTGDPTPSPSPAPQGPSKGPKPRMTTVLKMYEQNHGGLSP